VIEEPCLGANSCQPTCYRFVGGGVVNFTLVSGAFCGAASVPIANSASALMCSLSKIDIKNANGNCELRRNPTTRLWTALSSGNCADQQCAYSCLLSDQINITAFASDTFASALSPGRLLANSSEFDMCALTRFTDDQSISSSCEILRVGQPGWRVVSGQNTCGYSCATFSSLSPPTTSTSTAPTTTRTTTTTTAATTTAPTTTATATNASATNAFTPAPVTVPTTTRASTAANATSAAATTVVATSAAVGDTSTTASGNATMAASTAVATSAPATTLPESGVIIVLPSNPDVNDKDSRTLGDGKVTLRVRDFDPNNPVGVTIKAPRKIGPDSKLDLRFSGADVCELENGQALLVISSDVPITGTFKEIGITTREGKPAATFREFSGDKQCDRVSVVMSLSMTMELQFAVKLTSANCNDKGNDTAVVCAGKRPDIVETPVKPPSGDCELVWEIFCLWHLIVMGVGACLCCLLCVLLIACVATRRGRDDDDDDDDHERGDRLQVMLQNSKPLPTTSQTFAAVSAPPQPVHTDQWAGTQATQDMQQQPQQQQQQQTQETQEFRESVRQSEVGTYQAMPTGGDGSAAEAYGDIALSVAGDLPVVSLDDPSQWGDAAQQQQQQWSGGDPTQEQQWGGGGDQWGGQEQQQWG
jgi:hypothetical protein